MAAQLDTPDGQALYKQRKAIIEPVFAQLFARFGRTLNYRGDMVETEIHLWAAVHNMLKAIRARRQRQGGHKPAAAAAQRPPRPRSGAPRPQARTTPGSSPELTRRTASRRREPRSGQPEQQPGHAGHPGRPATHKSCDSLDRSRCHPRCRRPRWGALPGRSSSGVTSFSLFVGDLCCRVSRMPGPEGEAAPWPMPSTEIDEPTPLAPHGPACGAKTTGGD